MDNGKNRVDWARIIAGPDTESGGHIDHTEEGSLPLSLWHWLVRAFRKIRRKLTILDVLISVIGNLFLGFMIIALPAWLLGRLIMLEGKEPQSETRRTSSVKEDYNYSNMYLIDGEWYEKDSDGRVWQLFSAAGKKQIHASGWVVKIIESNPPNNFWTSRK